MQVLRAWKKQPNMLALNCVEFNKQCLIGRQMTEFSSLYSHDYTHEKKIYN